MNAKPANKSVSFDSREFSLAVSTQFMVLRTLTFWGDAVRFAQELNAARENWPKIFRCSDNLGKTLLMNAIEQKQLEILRLLVRAGADLEVVSRDLTALYMASQLGQLEMVRLLVEVGADKDYCHPLTKDTILMKSIAAGRAEVALYLIDRGATCDAKTVNAVASSTANCAVRYDQPEVFLRLVEMGVFEDGAVSPLRLAVQHDAIAVVRACLAHPELGKPVMDQRSCEALLKACSNEEVRRLLLSWRSEQVVASAFGGFSDLHLEPRRASVPSI